METNAWQTYGTKCARKLTIIDSQTVQFTVFECRDSDEDNVPIDTEIPFQVAYAVSIHKAQGLEYDSVKVVVTEANEQEITHAIFYTAITRAKSRLTIYWTPETQHAVLSSLHRRVNHEDVSLLTSRHPELKIA